MTSLINFIYVILRIIERIFILTFKKKIIVRLLDKIKNDSYVEKKILHKNLKFYTPSVKSLWRIDNLLLNEPETIKWIDDFKEKKDFVFWDIGANIGVYTLYSLVKHPNLKVVSFEPSLANATVLTRNISINNFSDRFYYCGLPLTNTELKTEEYIEAFFNEGSSGSTFGVNYTHGGKLIKRNNNYCTPGISIDSLIKKKIFPIPSYIKIDVDGIEHLILQGGETFLKDHSLIEISIELNENFKDQYDSSFDILKKSGFKFISKDISTTNSNDNKTFNHIFKKEN